MGIRPRDQLNHDGQTDPRCLAWSRYGRRPTCHGARRSPRHRQFLPWEISGECRGNEADPHILQTDAIKDKYYVSVTVACRRDVLAGIAALIDRHEAGVAVVNQKETNNNERTAKLVIMTHRAKERAMRAPLQEIRNLDVVSQTDSVLRGEG